MDFAFSYNTQFEGVVFSTDADGLAPIGLYPHQYPSLQRLVKLVREHLLKSRSSREPFLHTLDLFYKRTHADCAQRPTHELVLDFFRDSFPRINLTWSEAIGLSASGGGSWKYGYIDTNGHSDESLAERIKSDVIHLRIGLAAAYQSAQSEPHGLTAPQYGLLIVAQLMRELTLALAVHLYGKEAISIIATIQSQLPCAPAETCHEDCGHDHEAFEWCSGALVEKTILGGSLEIEWEKQYQGDVRKIVGLGIRGDRQTEFWDITSKNATHAHLVLQSLYSVTFRTFVPPSIDIRDDVSEGSTSTRVNVRESAVETKEKLVQQGKMVRVRATEVLHHKASPPNVHIVKFTLDLKESFQDSLAVPDADGGRTPVKRNSSMEFRRPPSRAASIVGYPSAQNHVQLHHSPSHGHLNQSLGHGHLSKSQGHQSHPHQPQFHHGHHATAGHCGNPGCPHCK